MSQRNDICRICMQNGEIQSIFISANNIKYAEKIMSCSAIQIFPDDKLPSTICKSCILDLNTAYTFKQQCERSDRIFRDQLKSVANREQLLIALKGEPANIGPEIRSIKRKSRDSAENRLQCEVCSLKVMSESALRVHMRSHTGERPWKCVTCSKAFTTAANLKRHFGIHPQAKTPGAAKELHFCSHCPRYFCQPARLKKHLAAHSTRRPHKCVACGAQFQERGALKAHSHQHSGERPFLCHACGVALASRGALATHLRNHHTTPQAQCTICEKRFASINYLREHMRVHTGERPFACTVCEKSYALRGTLKVHSLSHQSTGLHVCQHCGRVCTDLKAHLRTHSLERHLACPHCPRRFKHRGSLRYHILSHTGERKFSCEVCSKKFKTKELLRDHATLHTGERPYRCEMCEKSYRELSSLRRHTRNNHPKVDQAGTVSELTELQLVSSKIATLKSEHSQSKVKVDAAESRNIICPVTEKSNQSC